MISTMVSFALMGVLLEVVGIFLITSAKRDTFGAWVMTLGGALVVVACILLLFIVYTDPASSVA